MSWKPPSIGSREDFISPWITRRSALLEAALNIEVLDIASEIRPERVVCPSARRLL